MTPEQFDLAMQRTFKYAWFLFWGSLATLGAGLRILSGGMFVILLGTMIFMSYVIARSRTP